MTAFVAICEEDFDAQRGERAQICEGSADEFRRKSRTMEYKGTSSESLR